MLTKELNIPSKGPDLSTMETVIDQVLKAL
jgi:hypothetical protein